MSLVTAWLLTYALHSTLLLGLVALAAPRLGRLSLRLEERAWRAALFGALVSATLQVATGWTSPLALTVPAPPAAVILPAVPAAALAAAPAAPATAPAFSLPALPALWTLWLAAAGLLLLGLAFGHLRLRRLLRSRAEVSGGTMHHLLAELTGRAGLREEARVRLTCSPRVPTPLALGLFRQEICVPPRALAQLDEAQQASLLAHELGHLVRRDPLWLTGIQAFSRLFFFQPLNWLAARRLREISEMLCDDRAVAWTGGQLPLARCLTEVAQWAVDSWRPRLVPAMAGRPSGLSRRVHRLLDGFPSPERQQLLRYLTLGLLVLVGGVALLAPGVSAEEKEEAPVASVAESRPLTPEQRARIETLRDRAEELAEKSELTPEKRAEIERITERADKLSRELETRLEPLQARLEELAEQASGGVSAELEAEIERLTEKMIPSPEELARIEAAADRLAQSVQTEISAEERRELARQAREAAKAYRMSDEDKAELRRLTEKHREMAEKFRREHGAEMEALQKQIHEQVREQMKQLHEELKDLDHLAPLAHPHPKPHPKPHPAPHPTPRPEVHPEPHPAPQPPV